MQQNFVRGDRFCHGDLSFMEKSYNFEECNQKSKTMEIWHIWIIAALLLVIVEIFTSGFAVLCLSIGCVGGAVAAAVDASTEMQLLAFALTSFVALVAVRPILKRTFMKEEKVKTNADAMVGRRGVVCEAVESVKGGRVIIDGVDWKAESADGQPIERDAKVEVVAIESVVLIVKKL